MLKREAETFEHPLQLCLTENLPGVRKIGKFGNHGIHARFERDLIERYQSRLKLSPAAPQPLGAIRDVVFDVALNSYRQVDAILAADTAAAAGRDHHAEHR